MYLDCSEANRYAQKLFFLSPINHRLSGAMAGVERVGDVVVDGDTVIPKRVTLFFSEVRF